MSETSLPSKIARRLEVMGKTASAMARFAGMDAGFITDILSGRKESPQGRNLEKLAEALGVSPGSLLGDGDFQETLVTKSDRLRHARRMAGFDSAAAAARDLGVSGSTYAAHENGQNEFGEKEAIHYGKAFKMSWQWLLVGGGSLIREGYVGALPTGSPSDDGLAREIRDYVQTVLTARALSPSALAKQAGFSSSTLTRFLNKPDHGFVLSNTTIGQIERATGIAFRQHAPSVVNENQPLAPDLDEHARFVFIPTSAARTAATLKEAEQIALDAGGDGYIVKIVARVRLKPSIEALPDDGD